MSAPRDEKAHIDDHASLESQLQHGVGPDETRREMHGAHIDDMRDPNKRLHRGLQARQVAMIAIGGAIGVGLIVNTGTALAKAGPASVLISYCIVGFVVWIVMTALGEMATWLPVESGFTGYASRFVDPSFGFALGWTYLAKYLVTTPNQMTAGALAMQYWVSRDKVNPGVWITIILVSVVIINYFGVKFFGEIEFWLSSVKVLTLTGLIILSLVIALGGGPDHDRRGFRFWKNPGAFHGWPKTEEHSSKGKFAAFWTTFVSACFAFIGTELVGVTVGECQNPRKVIPKAIRLTAGRIIFFYITSVLLIGMIVPYNSPSLKPSSTVKGASASPFVVAMIESGIKGLPAVVNGCILLFVFSAANSDLYIASRTLYGLAKEGNAPKIFAKTNSRGIPINALICCSAVCLIAYLNVASASELVFKYFVNLVTICGLMAWVSLLVTHLYFIRARMAQGVSTRDLVYSAPLGRMGTLFALLFCCLIVITKNFDAFIYDPSRAAHLRKFDYIAFITGYVGVPIYLLLIFCHKWAKKTRGWSPEEADIWTGKDIIDAEERAYLEMQARTPKSASEKFYDKYISWLL